MTGFLLRKVASGVFVVFAASVLVFIGVRAIPGDTATVLAADNPDPAVIAAIRHEYLLDRPLPVQYGKWAWLALQGNLGVSEAHLSVAHTILQRVPITLELAALSLLVAVLIGIPAGMIAAARRGKPSDHVATGTAMVVHCVPHFWLGLMMIIWFAVDLHWLPATSYRSIHHPVANLRHLLMPCLVLGAGFAAVLMRQMRSAMLNSLTADYVRTARAKGLSEWRVVGKHAARNSLITVTTVIGLDFGHLLSGAAVVESIFSIPGFGRLGLEAINARDYTTIEGVVLFTACMWVVVNLLVDVVYARIDPRIRISGAAQK
jgi:peptide/nickel transport system permease protein